MKFIFKAEIALGLLRASPIYPTFSMTIILTLYCRIVKLRHYYVKSLKTTYF